MICKLSTTNKIALGLGPGEEQPLYEMLDRNRKISSRLMTRVVGDHQGKTLL